MSTDTEIQIYKLFHFLRFLLDVLLFFGSLLFLLSGLRHPPSRSSKKQWLIFNLCLAVIVFATISAVFSLIPLAPTYPLPLLLTLCTQQRFLEDLAQGQVAYALLALHFHRLGAAEWKGKSFLWFGLSVSIQWLCAYLLPLPQILLSGPYICLGIFPNPGFPIYSLVFLLAFPLFIHGVLFVSMLVFDLGQATNTQVYPAGEVDPTDLSDRSLIRSICLLAVLFDLLGYGPKSILAVVDLSLEQSIALYAALEVLPSLTLLLALGWLYKIYSTIAKNIPSIWKC